MLLPPPFPPHSLLVRATDDTNSAEASGKEQGKRQNLRTQGAAVLSSGSSGLLENTRLQLCRQDSELRVHSAAGDRESNDLCPIDLALAYQVWIGDLSTGWNGQGCFHCWIL